MHTNFAMLTLFCPEFKNKCVCMGGRGALPLVKGLFRNADLIELDVSETILCMPKAGVGFYFKCALERKQNMGVIADLAVG